MKPLPDIIMPTLLIDSERVKRNIDAFVSKFNGAGVQFRPHFKTHQSHAIGEWFRERGITRITVSSLGMAEYFARAGWNDITVAFPVNLLEHKLINELAQSITLNLLVESPEVIGRLDELLFAPAGVFIKIDTGTNRTGLRPENLEDIDACVGAFADRKYLNWKGFIAHAGHTYAVRNDREAIRSIYEESENALLALKKRYQQQFPGIIVSFGDTPGASILTDFNIDEMRPGNFVFYDLMQEQIGSCRMDDIATALICPVVATHEVRHEAVIYGGAIHLSKESLLKDQQLSFGEVFRFNNGYWDLDDRLGWVRGLSQEHGIIRLENLVSGIVPGDLLAVLPVHSCLTAQCMGEYYDLQGQWYDHFTRA